jgi:LuxR family transcriptional regulator, maltose regulon positive regulatory protein
VEPSHHTAHTWAVMTTSERMETVALEAGWQALRAGQWEEAKTRFTAALDAGETAEAFEGLGWAGYFLDEDPGTIDARERAYRLFREEGDDASAARVAAWLAADHLEFRGEPAVANGWLRRARRLLDGQPPGPDHGWLAIHEASMCLLEDAPTAARLGVEAAELGRRFDVPELEMVGLATEGQALVLQGEHATGMHRLDEASTLALSGEADLIACVGWACCYLISACEQVRDYDRAGQWCVQMTDFCERHGIGVLLGQCRAKYAVVLTWQGRWEEAETELGWAERELTASRPALVGEALVRLADLRRQQGRLDEAAELYARCEGTLFGFLGRAALALDRDAPEEAAELVDRYLRRLPPQDPERAGGLELTIRAAVRVGQVDRAREALEGLRELAARTPTAPLRSAALVGEGIVAATDGDHVVARRCFEDAVDLLIPACAPFEAARVRVELARSLDALDRRAAALSELERALDDLRQLGAAAEVARVEDLLRRWQQRGGSRDRGPAPEGPLTSLTPREREVLRLVAEGLTNHQIAERLVLSEHTVHRHVGNILRKLALPSRTAAASVATQHGLMGTA